MTALSADVRGVEETAKLFDRLKDELPKATDQERKKAAFAIQRDIKRLYRRRLKVRSGTLFRSVVVQPRTIRKGQTIRVGTNVPYALTHERGETIVPTGSTREIIVGRTRTGEIRRKQTAGKRIAIPLKAILTPSGVPRAETIDQAAMEMSRGRPFTTFVSKSGKAVMISIAGAAPIPIAALVSSVKIPRRRVWLPVTKRWAAKLGQIVSLRHGKVIADNLKRRKR